MEKIASLLLCGLSLAVIVIAKGMPIPDKWETGPGMFPMLIGISLLVFSLMLLIKKPSEKPDESADDDQVGPSARNLFFFLAVTILYVTLLSIIGFLASTMLYIVGAILLLGGNSKWYVIALMGIVSSLFIKYGFLYIFGVRLP
ncbi:MAG: tripartite tricarboxylate transporter TctB family protein [Rectinemataceae bacterium]|nr:tripartite tricarboxylate transporter TctB family protein [Rectinemataceae bacterium]